MSDDCSPPSSDFCEGGSRSSKSHYQRSLSTSSKYSYHTRKSSPARFLPKKFESLNRTGNTKIMGLDLGLRKPLLRKATKMINSENDYFGRPPVVISKPLKPETSHKLPPLRPVSVFATNSDSFPPPPKANRNAAPSDRPTQLPKNRSMVSIATSSSHSLGNSLRFSSETLGENCKHASSVLSSESSDWSGKSLLMSNRASTNTQWSVSDVDTLVQERPNPTLNLFPKISPFNIILVDTFAWKTLQAQLKYLVKCLRFEDREPKLCISQEGKLPVVAAMQHSLQDIHYIQTEAERLMSCFHALFSVTEIDFIEQEAARPNATPRLNLDLLIPPLKTDSHIEHPYMSACNVWLQITATFATTFSHCLSGRGDPYLLIRAMDHYARHLKHARSLVADSSLLYFQVHQVAEQKKQMHLWKRYTCEAKRAFLASFDPKISQLSRKSAAKLLVEQPNEDPPAKLAIPKRKVKDSIRRFESWTNLSKNSKANLKQPERTVSSSSHKKESRKPGLRHMSSLTDIFTRSSFEKLTR